MSNIMPPGYSKNHEPKGEKRGLRSPRRRIGLSIGTVVLGVLVAFVARVHPAVMDGSTYEGFSESGNVLIVLGAMAIVSLLTFPWGKKVEGVDFIGGGPILWSTEKKAPDDEN